MASAVRVNGQKANAGDQASTQPRQPFSWMIPHVAFAVILVGPEGREAAFGIQKDLLCARSQYFLRYFEDLDGKAEAEGGKIEYMIKLPDVTPSIFGYVQRYLYDREVWPDTDTELPLYEDLVAVWHFGHKHEVDGLCDKAIEAMVELKDQTRQIPGAALITKVWSETPESSPIRDLFLSWAQEYFRVADDPSQFAQSLPQAFLSALVMRMTPKLSPSEPPSGTSTQQPLPATSIPGGASGPRKNVNHRDDDDQGDEDGRPNKKARKSMPAYMGPPPIQRSPAAGLSSASSAANRRATLPSGPKKPGPGRRYSGVSGDVVFTDEQKVSFCSDLLGRMLSGPGYWTRLVKPFKYPVDPAADGVPDYFDKVKSPMDLTTIQGKMAAGEYTTAEAFSADVQLIVDNCKMYWKKTDPLYAEAEKFEKSFKEKFAEMHKWLAKYNGTETG